VAVLSHLSHMQVVKDLKGQPLSAPIPRFPSYSPALHETHQISSAHFAEKCPLVHGPLQEAPWRTVREIACLS
jgi:hypothetical protein